MEQIVRRDGRIYYGERVCRDADDAYCRFRNEYHESLGKRAYYRLNRIGQRKERIHGYGFVLGEPLRNPEAETGGGRRVPVRLLGLVAGSYCRILGGWDIPDLDEQEFDRWFDWAFSEGSGALMLVGRKDKSGRTDKKLNKAFR